MKKIRPGHNGTAMPDFYEVNSLSYHKQTFHLDPSSFLEPLLANLKEGASIVDVGCGSGRDLLWLKERGFRATGFDRSKRLAGLAKRNSGCEVVIGDFESYDFSEISVDALLLVGSLVHISPHKFPKVLDRIAMGLTGEGWVLLTLKEGVGVQNDESGRIFYLWQDEALRMVIADAGLTVIEFFRNRSGVRSGDIWLGYVLKNTVE